VAHLPPMFDILLQVEDHKRRSTRTGIDRRKQPHRPARPRDSPHEVAAPLAARCDNEHLGPPRPKSTRLKLSRVLHPRSPFCSSCASHQVWVAWIVAVFLASGWLTFVLERFPYTRPWGEGLAGNLIDLLRQIAVAISDAMPGLVLVVIIMLLGRVLVRVGSTFFRRVEDGKVELNWIDHETARPTRRIFNFAVWVFALAMAYPYLPGAGTEAFKGLSVLVGVMVSIGGASVVGQAFSGLILMYLKSFRRGDYVRIGDSEGTVIELGTFTTRIRTGLGEEITLPNSNVMNATTKNYSRAFPGTGCVVDTTVTIGYSTPWRQVHAMLEEAARRTTDIAPTPEPFIRKTALSDYYIEYRLIVYTPAASPERRADVLNRLHANILDVFNEHNVQIMSPHYMMDPAQPQVVPKDQWYAAPASKQ